MAQGETRRPDEVEWGATWAASQKALESREAGDENPEAAASGAAGRRGWLVGALAGVGAVVALLVVLLGGYQVAFAGRVYPGVQALGVNLSGQTREEAVAAVGAQANAMLGARVTLVAADARRAATWRELGLTLPAEALTDQALAVGRSGNPLRRLGAQWTAATSHYPTGADLSFDEVVLTRYLQDLGQAVDRPARDARLLVQPDATIEYTSSQSGRKLDVPEAAARIREARQTGAADVVLPVVEAPPQTPDVLRREAREFAGRVLARPLVLRHEAREWTVAPPELVGWLEFEGGPGQPLVGRVEAEAVRRRVAAIAAEIDQPAVNARLDWNGGAPRVIRASAVGRRLDAAAAQQLILARLPTDDHTVALPVQVAAPAVGDDVAALGIKELVEEARTSFAGSVPEKAHNIRLAAERLHGTVVPPGGTFSFNEEVGPTTLAAGFQWGFGITSSGDGFHTVPSVAGGICQVATTLFQAFFWGGYRLEERHWHLYWIPNYTSRDVVGLDATVDEDSGLDLKFINTTPHPVLIQAATGEDSVTFRLYGTRPSWKVEVAPPRIDKRVPPDPTPLIEEDPTLPAGRRVAVETAREGFEVVVARTVTEGSDLRTLELKSTYRPSRNVTLVGTAGAAPSAAPAATAQNRPVAEGARE